MDSSKYNTSDQTCYSPLFGSWLIYFFHLRVTVVWIINIGSTTRELQSVLIGKYLSAASIVFQCPFSRTSSDVLEPPISNADVTYWLNYHGIDERRNQKYGAINTAVEATTLNSRTFRLHPQDKFIRDNIQQDDVLIVSVGGNDIALAPTPCTIMSLLCLPHMCMEYSTAFGSIPVSLFCRVGTIV